MPGYLGFCTQAGDGDAEGILACMLLAGLGNLDSLPRYLILRTQAGDGDGEGILACRLLAAGLGNLGT